MFTHSSGMCSGTDEPFEVQEEVPDVCTVRPKP